MSLTTVQIEALVIRRSVNTNSFGLRAVWIITTNARRVFEFAVNHLDAERYQTGEILRVPFYVSPDGKTAHPAHELARQIGDTVIPAKDVPVFLRKLNPELATKWTAHKKANAIEAVTN